MTLRSRRKPQTTQQSTTWATPTDPPCGANIAREAYARAAMRPIDLSELPRAEPLWIPAGLMAVLLTLVSALGAFGGEVVDSGWRSTGGSPRVTPSTRTQQFRPATHHAAPRANAANRGRLRLVAFEPEADQTRVEQTQYGSARLRSVVVDPDGQRRGYRVAQDEELIEGFEQPFGAEELPPATDRPDFDPPTFDEPAVEEPTIDEPGFDSLPPLDEPAGRDPFDEPSDRATSPSPSDDQADEPLFDRGGLRDVEEDDLVQDTQPIDTSSSEHQRVMKNCADELAELKASRIAEIDLHIAPTGDAGDDYPFECGIDDGTPFADRSWPQVCYMWKASALCHKPLYFENVQLERYGHSWGPCIQPLVSGVHFFTRIPALPYCMGIQAPNECVYTLGHYRPGSCAPYLIEPIPFTWRAAALQGAAATGAVFAVP